MNHLQEDPQVLEGKVFALLSYLSILCIIPLALKKENPFVLHHGKQGLVLFIGQVALLIIQILLGDWIFHIGLFILGVLSFIGLLAVLQGRYLKLPVVFEIADKITL